MDLLDLIWHLAGFAAPAFWVALGMVVACRFLWQKGAPAQSLQAQLAINFIACLGALLAGLGLTGHDGRMLTYAALVLVSAGCQAWLLRRAAA